MSGFWKQHNEIESEEEVASEEEEDDDDDAHSFLLSSSSDDDDQQDRRVRTEKEKRWEEIRLRSNDIKNLININDWNGIFSRFDDLLRAVDKASSIISKLGVPVFFIRTLVRLEDALAAALEDKEAKKKMSTSNAKSLNSMKQRLRRHNKDYEEKIKAFREKPVETDDEEEEEEQTKDESESENETVSRPARIDIYQGDITWTRPMIKSKLQELVGNRGKKATDHVNQVKELAHLVDLAPDVRSKLEVLMILIAAQFDTRNLSTDVPVEHWRKAQSNLMDVICIIESSPHIKVYETDDYSGADTRIDDDDDTEDVPNEVRLRGSLLAFCERLDDELTKSLQNMDPHTKQYVNRLKDENLFLLLAVRLESHYLRKNNMFAVRRIALRRIEHIYNKREVLNPFKLLVNSYRTRTLKGTSEDDDFLEIETEGAESTQDKKGPSDYEDDATLLGERGSQEQELSIRQVLHRLAVLLYQSTDERAKTRAMLCEIFNLALEEKYYEARDLFLISHLQDGVAHTDISTQILYNRALVQLGITAFRFGLIAEAHSCLSELQSSGRVKELLAQGIATNRYAEKQNPELEKQARLRQMPYHMHINPELLDSVHLISAMLLEIPNHAMNPFDTKRKPISKYFRRLMDVHARQMFNGPPENTHDYIMVASNALSKGDVDRCCELLVNLKVWKLLPNPEPVKEMLCKCIREEGLRTYLFSYSRLYKSISAQQLSDMFKLPLSAVSSITSKMIINEELHASWDQPSGCVVMHNVEPSRLQTMSLQLADKVAALVENNEKILENRTGTGFDHKGRESKHRGHRQWHGKNERTERVDRGERRHDRNQYDRTQYETPAY